MQEKESKEEEEGGDMEVYAQEMHKLKKAIYNKAITNIKEAQRRQKETYDKKHCKKVVSIFLSCFVHAQICSV